MGESTEKPQPPGKRPKKKWWRLEEPRPPGKRPKKESCLLDDENEKYGLWIEPGPIRRRRKSDNDAEIVGTNPLEAREGSRGSEEGKSHS